MPQSKANPENVMRFTSETRILLSFGGREGGFELIMQMRDDIMARYQKKDPSFCYLDAISLENAPTTQYPYLPIDHPYIKTEKVLIDVAKMQNDHWDTYYPAAMKNSAVVVFMINRLWLDSQYCLQEFGWFICNAIEHLQTKHSHEVGCIFVIFTIEKDKKDVTRPPVLDEFNSLCRDIHTSLGTGHWVARLQNEKYKLMKESLSRIIGRRQAEFSTRSFQTSFSLDRLFKAIIPKDIVISSCSNEVLMAEEYDERKQLEMMRKMVSRGLMKKEDVKVSPTYWNIFEYQFSITQDTESKLYEKIDKKLAPLGIRPVKKS